MSLYCGLQSERMSVGRKKQQIAALDQAVHQARHDYNQKFMALAKLKEECIAQEPQPQKVGSQPQCWVAGASREVVSRAAALVLCLLVVQSKSDKSGAAGRQMADCCVLNPPLPDVFFIV